MPNPGAAPGEKKGPSASPSATGSVATGLAAGQPAPQVDPGEVDQLVAQVAAAEKLDPAVREQLGRDLRQTDPALWPAFVQQFRASLAYRRAREERERATAGGVESQQSRAESQERRVKSGESRAESQERRLESEERREKPPALDAHLSPFRSQLSTLNSPRTGVVQAAAFSEVAESRESRVESREPKVESREPKVESRESRVESQESRAKSQEQRGKREEPSSQLATLNSQLSTPDSPLSTLDWQKRLSVAIAALESELRDAPQSAPAVDLQARLRMLYLLADRREDALRPIASAPPAVQEFWSQELYGLAAWLDSRRVSDAGTLWVRRAGESKPALAGAVRRLGELGPLVVRNLAFITEVKSYGVYKPFAKNEFTPGQELLLYAEVEDFKSEDTPKGFHTVLQGSYQIFDARGQRVEGQDLTTVEEHCRNPRRDFYIPYPFSLPKRIYAGKHTLQLTLVDRKSQKIGQASIEFTVKDGGE